MSKDFYKTLGIAKGATDTEIKAAYRKAALQWHPDRNKSPEAVAKFKEVTEAYEVLSDPQKRQTYDQFGSSAFEQGGPGAGGPFGGGFGGFQQGPFSYSYSSGGQNPFGGDFGDPFEIFEQFFGGGFSSNSRRSRRMSYGLTISFMEAIKGVEKTVDLNGKSTKIKIPAGVDDNTRVRFSDFDIIVSVTPDKTFQREDQDLYVSHELDFASASLGTTITVPTIDGNVSLRVPPGTQPETLIRLKGKGVPNPRGGQPGDQYIKIKIVVPQKLTGEQKQLLEQFKKTLDKKSGWF